MGRKAKYGFELKLQCVKDHISGVPVSKICQRYGIPETSETCIRNWCQQYLKRGPDGLISAGAANRKYSPELKHQVVMDYLTGRLSLSQACLTYGISSDSVALAWVKNYKISLDRNNTHQGEKNMTSPANRSASKRFTTEQKIEAVHWCIEHDKDYQRTAERFGCSYVQIYSWVKKMLEHGAEALEDRRGRRKPDTEKTTEESSAHRIRQLEKENELLRRENILLKN